MTFGSNTVACEFRGFVLSCSVVSAILASYITPTASQGTAIACPPGFAPTNASSRAVCSACQAGPPGSVHAVPNSCSWVCGSGHYAVGNSCAPCPTNSSAPLGSTSLVECVSNATFLSPFDDWKQGMESAPDGARIVLAPGRYTGGCDLSIKRTLRLESSHGRDRTVLDCENRTRHIHVHNAAVVTIEGITMVNGNDDPDEHGGRVGGGCVLATERAAVIMRQSRLSRCLSHSSGGAFQLVGGCSVTLKDVIVVNCTAAEHGGGVNGNGSSSVVVEGGLELRDCQAGVRGGAVSLTSSTLAARDAVVYDCAAAAGGGLHAWNASVELDFVRFEGCTAARGGGWFLGQDSLLRARNVTVAACGAELSGGALHAEQSASAKLAGARVHDCQANLGAAFQLESSARLEAADAVVADNYAAGRGGAVNAVGAVSVELVRVEVARCSAGGGGGAVFAENQVVLRGREVSIVDAECRWNGGCIYAQFGSTVELENATVARCRSLYEGGGIQVKHNSVLIMRGSVVEDSVAVDRGGGLWAGWDSRLELLDVTVARCSCGSLGGGGVFLYSAAMHARNASFQDCASSGRGGGVYGNYNVQVEMHNVALARCSAGVHGGGLYLLAGSSVGGEASLLAQTVSFADCHAGLRGGAICTWNPLAALVTDDLQAVGCTAGEVGGAIQIASGSWQGRSTSVRDSSAVVAGAAVLAVTGARMELVNTTVEGCFSDRGGGVALSTGSELRALELSIQDCAASRSGGGLYVVGLDVEVELVNSVVRGCVSGYRAGGVILDGSSAMTAKNTQIEGCAAPEGGGVSIANTCILRLQDSQVSECAAEVGGAVRAVQQATVELFNVTLSNNSASFGGGVYANAAAVTARGLSAHANCAQDSGGALYLDAASARLEGSALGANCARLGGGVAARDGETRIGATSWHGDAAGEDGGCMWLGGDATVEVRDSRLERCEAGEHGGGVAQLGLSTLRIQGGVVVEGCSAREGGGLLAQGGSLVVRGEGLELRGNGGEERGGAVLSWGRVELQGGRTVLEGNRAGVGGGWCAVGYEALVVVGHNASLEVSNCTAALDGGGVALLDLASLELEEPPEACPATCRDPAARCRMANVGESCLTASCNFQGGKCSERFELAGSAAAAPCDRQRCEIVYERWPHRCSDAVDGGSPCVAADCDWSRENPHCAAALQDMGARCPLFDAVSYLSLVQQQGLTFIADGGTAGGLGRCNASGCLPPDAAHNASRSGGSGLWCEAMDDAGRLIELTNPENPTSAVDRGQAWGLCARKPSLPSRGFEYAEAEMRRIAALPPEQLMREFPGCGRTPVALFGNVAGKRGGGVFRSGFDAAKEQRGRCFLGGLQHGAEPAAMLLFEGNRAGAGAALFAAVNVLDACSAVMRSELGLPSLNASVRPRLFEFRRNAASHYGNSVASAAQAIEAEAHRLAYVPGQDALDLTLWLVDALGQRIDARSGPYTLQLLVCAASRAAELCSPLRAIQPASFMLFNDAALRTAQQGQSVALQFCEVGSDEVDVSVSVAVGGSEARGEIGLSLRIQCAACRPGQALQVTDSGLWTCHQCGDNEYAIDPSNASMECQPCPKGASCVGGTELVSRVAGAVWEADRRLGVYVLRSCPRGFAVTGAADTAENAQLQECAPCPEGSECTLDTCESCSPCRPGTYKDQPGRGACTPCPKDSFNAAPGATTSRECVECPLHSSTRGALGQTELRQCHCDEDLIQTWSGRAGDSNSSASFFCAACPLGGMCQDGTCALRLEANGMCSSGPPIVGTWERESLAACPRHHRVANTSADGAFAPELQICLPCGPGTQCDRQLCHSCLPCPPGTFKVFAAAAACSPCPENTYRSQPGASELSACAACPAFSSTLGATAQRSPAACRCNVGYYPAATAGRSPWSGIASSSATPIIGGPGTKEDPVTCFVCPRGAECDGAKLVTREGLDAIDGGVQWAPDSDGRLWLQRCPRGFRMENATGHELQECQPVPEGMFIASNADSSFTFQRCPDRMTCIDGGLPTSAVVSADITIQGWTVDTWSVADSAALKAALRKAVADPTLVLDISQVCLDDGGCIDQPSRRTGSAVTFRFRSASSELSSSELRARIEAPDFADSFDASLMTTAPGLAVSSSVGVVDLLAAADGVAAGEYQLQGTSLVLKSCPMGYLVVNSSIDVQECAHCVAGKYSLNPTEGCARGNDGNTLCKPRSCNLCPTGAQCEGPHVNSSTAGAVWRAEEETAEGFTLMRLAECPPGFVLVRSTANPLLDECLQCKAGSYSVVAAEWASKTMVASSADGATALCNACPFGAVCAGGSSVVPRQNFWRLPEGVQALRREAEEAGEGPRLSPSVRVWECPKHACLDGGVCNAGRDPVSPVCGTCAEGYALAGTVCTRCGDAASKGFQAFALVVLGIVFLAAWWVVAWQPFFQLEPKQEDLRDIDELSWKQLFKLQSMAFFKSYGRTIGAYAKIFISFWQVMATFESTYSAEWPEIVEQAWELGRALSLNILDFPGPNCLSANMSHLQVLQLTTVVPLAVCALLYIPTLILRLRGEKQRGTFRHKNTSDHFWQAALFWLFLIYPVLSITSVRGFKCREIGGKWLLEADLNSECPWKDPTSATFVWSVIASVLYPVGIPIFMWIQLRQRRIPELAAKKYEEAVLHEMLIQYKEYTSGTVFRELALNIGGGQTKPDERLILNRIKFMYDDASENGGKALTRTSFQNYLLSIGIDGAEEDMREVLSAFAVDEDGIVSWDNFALGMLGVVGKENHLIGLTAIADIQEEALTDLCRFRWDKLGRARLNLELDGGLDGSVHSVLPQQGGSKLYHSKRDIFSSSFQHSHAAGSRERDRPASAYSPVAASKRELLGEKQRRAGSGAASEGASRSPLGSAVRGLPSFKVGQSGHAAAVLLGQAATRERMLDFLLYQGEKLIARGAISVPKILWDGTTAGERDAIDRVGFLFENYRVEHHYHELLEMARKFFMTGLIIFLWPGSSEQLAMAVVVTAAALMYVLKATPYANSRIGSLQAAMLAAQGASLFYGLLLHLDALRANAQQRRPFYAEAAGAVVLILLSTVIFCLPPATFAWDNRREVLKYLAPDRLRRKTKKRRSTASLEGAVGDPDNLRHGTSLGTFGGGSGGGHGSTKFNPSPDGSPLLLSTAPSSGVFSQPRIAAPPSLQGALLGRSLEGDQLPHDDGAGALRSALVYRDSEAPQPPRPRRASTHDAVEPEEVVVALQNVATEDMVRRETPGGGSILLAGDRTAPLPATTCDDDGPGAGPDVIDGASEQGQGTVYMEHSAAAMALGT